jgi:hypothetical protein
LSYDKLITDFAAGYERIKAALDETPKEALDYRPSPQAWTVREIIHHMPDSEASGYVRCRKIIAQSGVTVDVYDQDLWAQKLDYGKRDMALALELFRLMRLYTLDLLRTVEPKAWAENFIMHPENGKMSLARWLELYAIHADKHAGQIKRNIAAWEKAGRPKS